ncbi:MFS transporter [Alloscardovia omnicolens]|uniref:MFS transporter n=1 Tax=Alloscardovia omnicolens TaxID=419015 RepID=UPI003A60B6D9
MEEQKKWWASSDYVSWFTADTASAIGLSLRALALSLLGLSITQSAVLAGWLGSLSMVVQLIMTIFGGTFVDRHSRKMLVIVNAICGSLIWSCVGILFYWHMLNFKILLVLSLVASGINGFLSSATDALLRSVIEIEYYSQARSLNEGRDATISMLGNPISGFLYTLHPAVPFLISAVFYFLSGAASIRIKEQYADAQKKYTQGSDNRTSFIADFTDGWSWTFHKPLLMNIILTASLMNFAINGIEYSIQFHLASEGKPATAIGFISTGIAVSMLLGSVIAGALSNKVSVGKIVCCSYLFMCICALPLIMTDKYWIIFIFNSFLGLPFPLINATVLGFVFTKVPENMQGRVTVTLTVPAQVLSAFCGAAAGSLLTVMTYVQTNTVFLLILGLSLTIVLLSPSLRRLPGSAEWQKVSL